MVRNRIVLGLALLAGARLSLADTQPAPQTARQALIEMFFSKTAGSLEKHLPEVTRAAISKARAASGTSMVDGLSLWTGLLQAHNQQLQTFDAGSMLLSVEDPVQHSKFEIIVERDDLRADEDSIELSFQGYKDGQPQKIGVTPRLTLTMKQEAGVWRLNEITVAVRMSLTDPELLKAITTNANARAAGNQGVPSPPNTPQYHAANGGDEATALTSLRVLLAAEQIYAKRYPASGFTCSLPDLGGMGSGGEANEHQAMLLDPRLATGRKNGYVFTTTACAGNPISHFKVTAVPTEPSANLRTLCSDESGQIRVSPDGSAGSCLRAGVPMP
ncbi:MAG: hypothetical protein WBQ09_12810 [Terriglobales bacterium]